MEKKVGQMFGRRKNCLYLCAQQRIVLLINRIVHTKIVLAMQFYRKDTPNQFFKIQSGKEVLAVEFDPAANLTEAAVRGWFNCHLWNWTDEQILVALVEEGYLPENTVEIRSTFIDIKGYISREAAEEHFSAILDGEKLRKKYRVFVRGAKPHSDTAVYEGGEVVSVSHTPTMREIQLEFLDKRLAAETGDPIGYTVQCLGYVVGEKFYPKSYGNTNFCNVIPYKNWDGQEYVIL